MAYRRASGIHYQLHTIVRINRCMVGAMDVWRWEMVAGWSSFFGGLVLLLPAENVFVLRMAIFQEKSVTCHNATQQKARIAGLVFPFL
ncbi:hypothetical protein [Klebsiella aerogenes]|uniref:hypothetical protein n=1 Tax=Klebsiella aerogenes TaxID=548 RepID=UPI001D174F45|nr:hypothetical protein [Klebsiella aerogenes]